MRCFDTGAPCNIVRKNEHHVGIFYENCRWLGGHMHDLIGLYSRNSYYTAKIEVRGTNALNVIIGIAI